MFERISRASSTCSSNGIPYTYFVLLDMNYLNYYIHKLCHNLFLPAILPKFTPYHISLCRSHYKVNTRATNYLRQLVSCLATGVVPGLWKAEYSSLTDITIGSWVTDLVARTKALDQYKPFLRSRGSVDCKKEGECLRYWMGGMFAAHSFITATRQHAAQVSPIKSAVNLETRNYPMSTQSKYRYNSYVKLPMYSLSESFLCYETYFHSQAYKWSLEDVELYLEVGCDKIEGMQDVIVEGLIAEGAKWAIDPSSSSSSSSLQLCEELRSSMPPSRLRWRLRQDKLKWSCVTFPLYLNSSRTELVAEVLLRTSDNDNVAISTWARRGVAFIMQSQQL